ncbi:hypothetical protein ACFXDE_27645 [Kitasatospora sp. NPDC059408]|uniref:hypothetical protein n=1 Tax=Kitasatospora sp. NPDC059408 TaxID=3346823 RepID=UPI00368E4B5B
MRTIVEPCPWDKVKPGTRKARAWYDPALFDDRRDAWSGKVPGKAGSTPREP